MSLNCYAIFDVAIPRHGRSPTATLRCGFPPIPNGRAAGRRYEYHRKMVGSIDSPLTLIHKRFAECAAHGGGQPHDVGLVEVVAVDGPPAGRGSISTTGRTAPTAVYAANIRGYCGWVSAFAVYIRSRGLRSVQNPPLFSSRPGPCGFLVSCGSESGRNGSISLFATFFCSFRL